MESRVGPDMTEVRVLVQFRTIPVQAGFLKQFHNGSVWFCVEKFNKQGFETRTPKNTIEKENKTEEEIVKSLKMINPSIIPRNHIVENIINQVVIDKNIGQLNELISMLKEPYNDYEEKHIFLKPPKENEDIKNTFCGT